MEKMALKSFLGANSFEGFVSYFDKCFEARDNWRAYIIKGGPGTGKSSFMKRLVKIAQDNSIKYELCPCSSDPDSLDAVIFPEIKAVIMDGTSPHTVDPVYPAVCEEILNFGEFWNSDKIRTKSKEIIRLTDKNKFLHRMASGYLKASGEIMRDNLNIINLCTEKEKALSFAKKLCKKFIPKNYGVGYEWVRFLEGITPKGIVSYIDTARKENTVIIQDNFGTVSNIIMERIREYSLSNGYDIITIKNAFLPSRLIDGVIIPELSLSFLRESDYSKLNCDTRRIHSRRFILPSKLKNYKTRIKANKKAISSLLDSAINTLKEAKSVHDELESYYISAMDFDKLSLLCDKIAKNLF